MNRPEKYVSEVNRRTGDPMAWNYNVDEIDAFLDSLQSKLDEQSKEIEAERESKNTAYSERDRLVCAISKVFPSWMERHPDSDVGWENDWRWIVFVTFPTGQASWHIHDSELCWFDHLERMNGNSWDGHSTAEKYARIERFERIGELVADSKRGVE